MARSSVFGCLEHQSRRFDPEFPAGHVRPKCSGPGRGRPAARVFFDKRGIRLSWRRGWFCMGTFQCWSVGPARISAGRSRWSGMAVPKDRPEFFFERPIVRMASHPRMAWVWQGPARAADTWPAVSTGSRGSAFFPCNPGKSQSVAVLRIRQPETAVRSDDGRRC